MSDHSDRYVIVKREPSQVERDFGLLSPLYSVWDMAMYKRVPFGNYPTEPLAKKRIRKLYLKGLSK